MFLQYIHVIQYILQVFLMNQMLKSKYLSRFVAHHFGRCVLVLLMMWINYIHHVNLTA